MNISKKRLFIETVSENINKLVYNNSDINEVIDSVGNMFSQLQNISSKNLILPKEQKQFLLQNYNDSISGKKSCLQSWFSVIR